MADLPLPVAVLFPPRDLVVEARSIAEGWRTAELAPELAAPPPASSGDAARPAAPSIAMGLSGINDWSTQFPFIDLMKSARPWIGHLPGQWGGWDHQALAAAGYLDEAGWPKAIPPELTGLSTLILTDQPAAATSLGGRYRLTYRGVADIHFDGRLQIVSKRSGEIWFDYTPGEGGVLMTITQIDPAGTGDYLREIEIVKAGNIELHEAGALFNPDWIVRIEDFRALRFMDWMATNNSPLAEWQDRPKPDDYTYAWRGAPVEVMVRLANEVAADPWFTLPHLATDEHFRRFAEYVRDHLDRDRKAFVEFSNETWNWMFGQTHWALESAKARWGDRAGGDAWMQFNGMRAAQMAAIWDEVFAEEADDRLVRVLSTQTGWLGLEAPLLEAPLWVAEDPTHNRPPASYFDAYGVTGYFGGQLGGEKAPEVLSWLDESRQAAERDAAARGLTGPALAAEVERTRFDLAAARAATELRDGSVTGRADDSIAEVLGRQIPYHAEVASRHGLDLMMYEGGTHVTVGHEWRDNAELNDFLLHLNYSPEMGGLYQELLAGWRTAGGTLFNAFVDVAGASVWGSWGALRHLDDTTPRWDVLDRVNRTVPAWWEVRPAGAFDGGLIERGSDAADEIVGTSRSDTLLGGPGDDLLVSAGGDDRLDGGAGSDTALLPGRATDYVLSREGAAIRAGGPYGTSRLVAIETVRFAEDGTKLATGAIE